DEPEASVSARPGNNRPDEPSPRHQRARSSRKQHGQHGRAMPDDPNPDRPGIAARIATIPWQSVMTTSFGHGDRSRWNGLPARPPQRRTKQQFALRVQHVGGRNETFVVVVADDADAAAR